MRERTKNVQAAQEVCSSAHVCEIPSRESVKTRVESRTRMTKNRLYYGDNLDVLRRYIPDASIDLVYLDPPFNSNASYNVLFEEKDGIKGVISAYDPSRILIGEHEQRARLEPARIGL
jgi:16S rRNA G966 N2-methylase RsmD